MADDEFTLRSVQDFMVLNGCKVTNHQVVTNFKRFLNDPATKGINREKFKDYVNTLATIKIEENGEKVLVLKKKFRQQQQQDGDISGNITRQEERPRNPPEYRAPPNVHVTSPVDNRVASPDRAAPVDYRSPPDRVARLPQEEYRAPVDYRTPPGVESLRDNRAPPAVGTSMFYTSPSVTPPPQYRAPPSYSSVRNSPTRSPTPQSPPPYNKQSNSNINQDKTQKTTTVDNSDGGNISKPQEPIHIEEKAQIASVLDRARQLNRIESETELQQIQLASVRKRESKAFKTLHDHDGDDVSYVSVSLNETEREWMIKSSAADYQPLAKLLYNNPHLAKRKDFTNGLTALHWAAKHGKPDVIKLIAGSPEVNVNAKSHGGYTALHLAAMHGNEDIIELLVQTYHADPNIRDHSGKKPKQYLKNSASSRVSQYLQTRRTSTALANQGSSSDSQLSRTGSISAKVRKTTHAFSSLLGSAAMRNSWAGVNEGAAVPGRRTPSPRQSPGAYRRDTFNINNGIREQRASSFGSKDSQLMPPPKAPLRTKKSKDDQGTVDDIHRSESEPAFDNQYSASYV